MHRELIDKIIEHGEKKDMEALDELFEEMLCEVKSYDKVSYLHYVYCLHLLACGESIGEKAAKHWVAKMENKDGTHGEH